MSDQNSSLLNSDGSIQSAIQREFQTLQNENERLVRRSEAIERDTQRLDAFMGSIRWLITSFGGVVFAIAIFIGWAGFSSLASIKEEVSATISTLVEREIATNTVTEQSLQSLKTSFAELESDYLQYREYMDALAVVQNSGELSKVDPQFAYEEMKKLEQTGNLSDEDRRIVLTFLTSVIESGQQGRADPNTVFNSGVVAGRLGFDQEALKLGVIANHWKPSLAYKVYRLEQQELFGVDYQIENGQLVKLDTPASEVRSAAWQEMLRLVAQVPRADSEQVYSRSANTSQRNDSAGYPTQLINQIELTVAENHARHTSYAFASLANLYAWRGDDGWYDQYWWALGEALEKMETESPLSGWYAASAQTILRTSKRLGALEQLAAHQRGRRLDINALVDAAQRNN